MRAPNLLIAGAQKCGTTWLHTQIQRHPSVFMSDVKELNYFHNGRNYQDQASFAEYLEHFRDARDERYVGESTPHYFWKRTDGPFSEPRDFDTAEFVRDKLGDDVTIIISLRDPVSRTTSAYQHNFAMGRITPDQGVFRCPGRMGLVDLGFYKRHWQHWEKVFGAQRLKLLLFDDLEDDPALYLRQALDVLDLPAPAGFLDDDVLRKRIGGRGGEGKRRLPRLTNQEVAALVELYAEDIAFVRQLSGRELPRWSDLDYLVERNCDP